MYVYFFKVVIHVSKNIPTLNWIIFNFLSFKPDYTTFFFQMCLSNEFLNVLICLKKTKRKKATLMISKLGSVT